MEYRIIDIEYKEAIEICKNLIRELYDTFELNNNVLSFSTKTSILSWGETISIEFTRIGNKTKITIISKSNAQIIDWGINKQNEKKIMSEILKSIQ